QQQRKKEVGKKEESYSRPKPTRPIRPEIPGANRYRDDKVFLEYADSLFKIDTRDTVERQIVKGNVKFRQAGMWMYCDSAYYYPNLNSLDAFGHVRMEQGDTLFVYADKLYYEGNEKLARLKNGPSYAKVRLVNRDVTLTTDSLDYSLAMELGWYEKWGTIDDKVNTLTSLYGEYSPGTKNADFYKDVVLVNNEDGYTLLTDTLHYNTATHIARIESETAIQGANDTIITTRGVYDTQAGNAELLTRSMIIHRDSNNNVTTLEGDSIIYDKQNRISRAYMFRNPLKTGMPMVLTDTAHKTTLIGGFGIYNDSTREALATEYPMLMEYSQGDTLFLRADTIKTYIISELVAASRRWTASGFPEKDGIPVLRASDGIIWLDSMFFSLVAPLSELPVRLLSKVAPMQASSEKGNRPEMPRKPDPFKEMAHEKSLAVGDSADSIVLN
ncbi:MAG: LPS export ABC transporter periplasmic protein LptC, partial [Muribaculaceae bacterium]|nr:LPS export ABC transporter periplasmic protein LptC [Muribaculaceae bacterium]